MIRRFNGSKINPGWGLNESLSRENVFGQNEIGDAERVLEEVGENVVVCDGGATAGVDRGGRGSPEVEGGCRRELRRHHSHRWKTEEKQGKMGNSMKRDFPVRLDLFFEEMEKLKGKKGDEEAMMSCQEIEGHHGNHLSFARVYSVSFFSVCFKLCLIHRLLLSLFLFAFESFFLQI